MRFSKLFGKTLRESPTDISLTAHQLMIRAGVMRPTGTGAFTYLPLGTYALQRLRRLVLEAFPDAQEVIGDPTSLTREVNSYRDLPKTLYHHQATTLFIDAFSVAPIELSETLQKIFAQSETQFTALKDVAQTTTFALPQPQGGLIYLRCDKCGYSPTKDAAKFVIEDCGCEEETLKLQKVGTPNCNTIAALATFLNLPKCQTLKAVMYYGDGKFVFVVVRGDLEVSVYKIKQVLGAKNLRPATEEEIKTVGAVPGYASPYGLNIAPTLHSPTSDKQAIVIVDESIHTGKNFAAGANEFGYHFINVNYPRDFKATLVADIASPVDGLRCGACHEGYLRETNGIKVASCTPRSSTAETVATFINAEGKSQPINLTEIELDLEAWLTAIIETHHDGQGLIFPENVAPFDVHLVVLGKVPATQTAAEELYETWQAQGKRVLYDERNESAGVKFADADLIGLPVRITVSDKSLQAGGGEVKRRNSAVKEIVSLEKLKT